MPHRRSLAATLNRFAIPRLTLYIIVLQVVVFVLHFNEPRVVATLMLVPAAVLAGQWWRVFTFAFIPPATGIWLLVDWYFFYFIGTALENTWGASKYTAFMFLGWLFTAAAAFIVPNAAATNEFIMGSTFLAFAFIYPEYQIMLFFVLPVKVKYLAWLAWGYFLVTFITGNWMTRLMVAAPVANFLVFFGRDIWRGARRGHRRLAQRTAAMAASENTLHRCTTCGVTERSNPTMEFRYCDRCAGAPGYCEDHINNHVHIA